MPRNFGFPAKRRPIAYSGLDMVLVTIAGLILGWIARAAWGGL